MVSKAKLDHLLHTYDVIIDFQDGGHYGTIILPVSD